MSRAVAPVLGTLLLVAITVTLAAAAGSVALMAPETPSAASPVVLSASVNASVDRITMVHESGPTLDVRELRVRVTIDGTPLVHQPPVPFFNSPGFVTAPRGPFNVGADPYWTAGEETSFRVAGANQPFTPGSRVAIRVYRGDHRIASLQVTAH